MKIVGFLKTSFMDWDGRIVSVIFLPGCTFRCPFCYNYEMAVTPEKLQEFSWESIKEYLAENKDFLDGVCITGGEPTLTKELPQLCKEIKELGLKVKLDSNGTNPEMLKQLIDEKLIDFVAMDIKAPFEKYSTACGVNDRKLLDAVKQSVKIIMKSGIDYEFRTTVVPTLHTYEDIQKISEQIKEAKKYVIQNFLPENAMNLKLREQKSFNRDAIEEFMREARKNIKNVIFRGKAA
ncbi:MAG: anaerobic ribonucleoside-triphosphate reductase activating protein [Candidatus Woesearchaeota archaeon]